MHAILVTMGTDGDVVPFIGLGIKLKARGHRVTLTANQQFQKQAIDLGFGFRSLASEQVTQRMLLDPDLWHPLKCGLAGARTGVGLFAEQYTHLSEMVCADDTVLIAHPGVMAARLVQEKLSRPLVTLVLQPWMIPSNVAPPRMPAFLSLPRAAPRPLKDLYWWLIDRTAALLVGRHLNRLRASIGLVPVRRLFPWWLSPERVIGMFPAWYGPPQTDWPAQIKLAGFPLYDGGDEMTDDIAAFCRAGPAPIVFTLGTGMMHAARFFRSAVAACAALNCRGLFLTKFPQQLPRLLPDTIRHCSYAPFQKLFPLAAAVVHHGGAGTTAKALASGTPQLILPLAWDQPDNAARVHKLGVGTWLKASQRSSRHLARALTGLQSPRVRSRCLEVAGLFGNHDALETTANWVEEQFRSHGSQTGKLGIV
jgi:rhamnosyltransferase subunit B